jgi:SAM-dependent methyltransferase
VATDHFVDQPEHKTCEKVQFLTQPDPLLLPDSPPLDLILLRRVAHHLTDLYGVLTNIHSRLKPGGHLILIEDSFNEQPQELPAGVRTMVDTQLTRSFRQTLSIAQRLTFLRFNDFYTNHLFHGWTSMPLPLGHQTFGSWIETLRVAGFRLVSAFDCGFPLGQYNLHQAATGFLLFQIVTNDT